MEKIKLIPSGEEEPVEFYVLEETRIAGIDYLLVTDSDDEEEEEDGTAWILKDTSEDGDEDAVYEFLEDDEEMMAVSKVFEEMMEDVDIQL